MSSAGHAKIWPIIFDVFPFTSHSNNPEFTMRILLSYRYLYAIVFVIAQVHAWQFRWNLGKPSRNSQPEAHREAPAVKGNGINVWLQNVHKQTQEELALLDLGSGALTKYESRQSDCYKDAATALRKGCQDLSIAEHEKIGYATRLTLCEIATANMVVPMECTNDYDVQNCVQALSRTPQLWTSYSGYFRDVIGMCFAVRYQIERELLEDMFYNLTYQQLLNNKMLKVHADDIQAYHQIELRHFENMTERHAALISRSDKLEQSAAAVSRNLQNVTHGVTNVATAVADLHTEHKKAAEAVTELRQETMRWLGQATTQIDETSQALTTIHTDVNNMGSDLESMREAQAAVKFMLHDLQAVVTALGNATQIHSSSIANALSAINASVVSSQRSVAMSTAQQAQSLEILKGKTDALMEHQLDKFTQLMSGINTLDNSTLAALDISTNISNTMSRFHSDEMERLRAVNETVAALSIEAVHLTALIDRFREFGSLQNWGKMAVAIACALIITIWLLGRWTIIIGTVAAAFAYTNLRVPLYGLAGIGVSMLMSGIIYYVVKRRVASTRVYSKQNLPTFSPTDHHPITSDISKEQDIIQHEWDTIREWQMQAMRKQVRVSRVHFTGVAKRSESPTRSTTSGLSF